MMNIKSNFLCNLLTLSLIVFFADEVYAQYVPPATKAQVVYHRVCPECHAKLYYVYYPNSGAPPRREEWGHESTCSQYEHKAQQTAVVSKYQDSYSTKLRDIKPLPEGSEFSLDYASGVNFNTTPEELEGMNFKVAEYSNDGSAVYYDNRYNMKVWVKNRKVWRMEIDRSMEGAGRWADPVIPDNLLVLGFGEHRSYSEWMSKMASYGFDTRQDHYNAFRDWNGKLTLNAGFTASKTNCPYTISLFFMYAGLSSELDVLPFIPRVSMTLK